MSQEDSLSEWRVWRDAGLGLRRKLETERAALQRRVSEIDTALAGLPPEQMPAAVGVAAPHGELKKEVSGSGKRPPPIKAQEPISARIVDALRLNPNGRPMSAPQIIEAVIEGKSEAAANNVHSTLYRLRKNGEIVVTGARRNLVFSLPKPSTAGE